MMMARWDSADKNGTSHVHYGLGCTCDFCHLFCWVAVRLWAVFLCAQLLVQVYLSCCGVLACGSLTCVQQLPTLWDPCIPPIFRHVLLLLGHVSCWVEPTLPSSYSCHACLPAMPCLPAWPWHVWQK